MESDQTRQGQTIGVDLRAHKPSRLTATRRQCADGRYDVEQGMVASAAGRVTFTRPGLSMMQVIVPVPSPSCRAWRVAYLAGALPVLPGTRQAKT